MTSALIQIWAALFIGGFAGAVNYAQRFAGKPEERPPWEWRVASIKTGTGSFVGVLTLWAVETTVRESNYVYLAIAVAGYGGPLTLDFALELAREAVRAFLLRTTTQGGKDDAPKN